MKKGGFLGATLLVAGTVMGGGMIGMPIITGLGGFIPTFFLLTLIWVGMTLTAFLLLEVTLGMPDGANMISMANVYFGKTGKYIVGIFYLFFYFCGLISYPAASVPLLADLVNHYFNFSLPNATNLVIFGIIFGTIIFLGVRTASLVNALFMFFFFVLFFFLVYKGMGLIKVQKLVYMDWTLMFLSGPVLFTSFCFHFLIPTLTTYLKRDVKLLKQSIFTGMLISYISYIIWNCLIIGTFEQGVLWVAFERSGLLSQSIALMKTTPWLGTPAILFCIFALVTSLIGLGLSMLDFLADGFKWRPEERRGIKRLILCIVLFAPMMIFSALYPSFFLHALGYTGGFFFAFLNGILPVALAWRSRYHLNQGHIQLVRGGRILFLVLLIGITYIIYLQAVVLVH